jgi:chromosome segregation ATPase
MKEDNIKENASLSETKKEEMLKLLEEEKQKSNTTIDELNKELAKIKQELESSNMSVENGLVTIDSIKDEKNKMEEDLKKHETDVLELNDKIEEQKNMNKELIESNLVKESENANIKSATEQLSKQLSDATNENAKLTAELTSQIEQNKTDVENAIEAIKEEETKNKNLQAQIVAKQKELTDLDQANEGQKQSLITTINLLKTYLTNNANHIVTLNQELKTQTEKLEKTNAQIKSLTDEKSKIEASFNELRAANDAQNKAHAQENAEAKNKYDEELAKATAKASAEQTSKDDLQTKLATTETEKIELETKLASETTEKEACEEKLQQLQNRELKLAKELLLLKLQLDLEKQIKASSVPSTVTSVAAPTYSNATVSNMFDDLLEQGDLDLKGGSAKQKLIMTGGALSLFDGDKYIVIEKEKAEKLKTQLTGYQSRYKTMKAEIENLTTVSTNASTTPICAFVNKMVNGNNQTELMKKYLKEIVLLKTQYAKNVKELLFEKIANQVNQQIVQAALKSRSATSAPSATSQISPAIISSLEGYIKPNIAFVPGNK